MGAGTSAAANGPGAVVTRLRGAPRSPSSATIAGRVWSGSSLAAARAATEVGCTRRFHADGALRRRGPWPGAVTRTSAADGAAARAWAQRLRLSSRKWA